MNFSRMRRGLVGALSTCILLSAVAPVYADTDLGNDDPLKNNQNQFRTVEDNSFTVETKTTSQWTGHSNLEFVFTNAGSETIHDWYFTFDFDYVIENPYNCYIVEQKDNLYTIGNNDWNQDIHPGESVTIGFTASSDDDSDIEKMPSFYLLNTETYTLTADELSYNYEEYSNWNEGFTGAIVLSNNTEDSIRDWSISFSSNRTLTLSDSSIFVDNSDGIYTIVNDGFSQNITAGQSFRFGIQGGENDPSVPLELSDYSATATRLALSLDDDKNENGVLDVLETDFNPIPVEVPTEAPTEVPTEEPTPTVTVTPEPTVTVEPTPVVTDPYIDLTSDEDEFLTDVASQSVGFFAQANFTVSYIEVVDGAGNAICYLYDDGDYSGHNDDIGGDGVYSGKASINTSSECTYEFVAVADYEGETISSDTKTIYVYKFITDNEWEEMDAVDEAVFTFITSPEYNSLSHEDRVNSVIAFLADIAVNGVEGYKYSLIDSDSITYHEEDDTVSFLYACGFEGEVFLGTYDPDLGGPTPTPEIVPTPSPSATPTATPSPSATPTPEIVPTPSPSATPTATPSPSVTPTPEIVPTPTPSATPTATPTPTPIPVAPNTNTDYSGDVIILYSYTNIYDPNQARSIYDDYKDFADGYLTDEGYDSCVIANYTIDDLRTGLTDKDVIIIASHGGYVSSSFYFVINNGYTAYSSETNKDISRRDVVRRTSGTGFEYKVYPTFFESHYKTGQLLEGGVVLSGSCHSYGDPGNTSTVFSNKVLNCGAEAIVTFDNSVYQGYARDVFFSFMKDYLVEGLSIQESYNDATRSDLYLDNDDSWYSNNFTGTNSKSISHPHIMGNTSYEYKGSNTIRNGGFELDFYKWAVSGDSRVITQLGSGNETIYPLEGVKMAIITTGTGSGQSAYLSGSNESSIKYDLSLLNWNRHLTFSYNMISEEVTEYVGSGFDDSFAVYAILHDGTKVELLRNSVNTATWKTGAGEMLSTVNFPGGDNTAYQTGWIFCDINLADYGIAFWETDEIVFAVTDVGDSAYDTVVLIDDVEFD